MKDKLINFIKHSRFPCLMAKSVVAQGHISYNEITDIKDNHEIDTTLFRMHEFVDDYRKDSHKLSSFILTVKNPIYKSFEVFEETFWRFLNQLHLRDKKDFDHDPRVEKDPGSGRFSFSIKEEAFFILALHPKSPRTARRFYRPTIVFNPHQQFESLRKNGTFLKIRNLIRRKDKILQGTTNPMLQDFGKKSEVFQYLGKVYDENDPCPLKLGDV